MSKKDKFGYWFYKKSKGVHWGSNFGGLPFYNTKELQKGYTKWRKTSYSWTFGELYYQHIFTEEEEQNI